MTDVNESARVYAQTEMKTLGDGRVAQGAPRNCKGDAAVEAALVKGFIAGWTAADTPTLYGFAPQPIVPPTGAASAEPRFETGAVSFGDLNKTEGDRVERYVHSSHTSDETTEEQKSAENEKVADATDEEEKPKKGKHK